MTTLRYSTFAVLCLLLASCAPAVTAGVSDGMQASSTAWPPARPLPQAVEYPLGFQEAIEVGTRTETGVPGPNYWQQSANYDIAVRVDTDENRLDGTTTIVYQNGSPFTLSAVLVEMIQNIHKPGAPRSEEMEVTEGIELGRVAVAGREIASVPSLQTAGYQVNGTQMGIRLPEPVGPGESVEIEIAFGFDIPQQGAGARMGHDSGNLVFLAYFHPRMSVLDDVDGWAQDAFLGNAEFYHDFGDYTYSVDAPAGWIVVGTGDQLNREETLAPAVLARLRQAESGDEVVTVVGPADFDSATQPGTDGRLIWRFSAEQVSDIAVSLTRESQWDATRASVGDRDGDGVENYARVDAIWRDTAPLWNEVARYAQHSIEFLSGLTETPYPWPHMTAVEAAEIIGGGMEYPQMTLIGDYTSAGATEMYAVVVHEFAHMWLPMIAATNERRYAWFDEGSTTFAEAQAKNDFFAGTNWEESDRIIYLNTAEAGLEGELMRWSDFHYPGPAYGVASYMKPSTVLVTLRELLGEETFLRAYREFFNRWEFKHPYPWDLWNTFEDVSGQDLDWFWYSWYYTTWTLDQAVESVESQNNGSARITIVDRGKIPMPARIRITRQDGSTLMREVPVDEWLSGSVRATVTVPAGSPVTRVEIDPDGNFPDTDRDNNIWAG